MLQGLWESQFPSQGLNQDPWEWKPGILTTRPPENSLQYIILFFGMFLRQFYSFFFFLSIFEIISPIIFNFYYFFNFSEIISFLISFF